MQANLSAIRFPFSVLWYERPRFRAQDTSESGKRGQSFAHLMTADAVAFRMLPLVRGG